MTVLLNLEPTLEAQVTRHADRLGVPVPEYLHNLIAQTLAETSRDAPAPQALGWPAGYFESTFGALADDPLARPPQGTGEAREPLA